MTNTLDDMLAAASAPCRVDLGGTLDISTLHLPLRRYRPCTFNIALDLRTAVRIGRYRNGWVCISSRGFDDAAYPADALPFVHPMGLLFAVAAYFGIHGIHIDIQSQSPPRSGLGGSSVAAVALIAALNALEAKTGPHDAMPPEGIARLAHAIESGVAGVPCGIQDQLAAAFGGVNAWMWPIGDDHVYQRTQLGDALGGLADFSRHILVAYCGTPHDSKDINARWIRQFLNGESRPQWIEIIDCGNHFVEAIRQRNLGDAVEAMNRETDIRTVLTPDVFNAAGYRLIAAARDQNCGGRFTGAGGGGCIWALGAPTAIGHLRESWREIVAELPTARVLDTAIDPNGVMVHSVSH
ncbi:MAG: galactokinase [Pseudomonadota bacterium]